MSDTEKTEEELIPIETPPEEAPAPAEEQAAAEDDDGEEDDGDSRLATSDDDHEADAAAGTNNARRKKRREIQKRAKELAQAELAYLRQQNAQLAQRMAAIEGHTVSTAEQTVAQRLAQAERDAQQAEMIMARAIEAANGEDAAAALRIRDAALAEAQQMRQAAQQLQQARPQQTPAAPAADPRVATYAKEWMDANPWYDPGGGNADSAITKDIDNALAREGYDPRNINYWQELTRRVADAIGDDAPAKPAQSRKGPPVGAQREHAPPRTKNEIYVTPERKQAMIEAGVWDDPQKRQRYLKAYQSYDSSAR